MAHGLARAPLGLEATVETVIGSSTIWIKDESATPTCVRARLSKSQAHGTVRRPPTFGCGTQTSRVRFYGVLYQIHKTILCSIDDPVNSACVQRIRIVSDPQPFGAGVYVEICQTSES